MVKTSFVKKSVVTASGILDLDGDGIAIEVTDTGQVIFLKDAIEEFRDKIVTIEIRCDEVYA